MKPEKDVGGRIILFLPKKIHARVKQHAGRLNVSITKYLTLLIQKEEEEFYQFFKTNLVIVLTKPSDFDDSLFATKKEEIKITRELKDGIE